MTLALLSVSGGAVTNPAIPPGQTDGRYGYQAYAGGTAGFVGFSGATADRPQMIGLLPVSQGTGVQTRHDTVGAWFYDVTVGRLLISSGLGWHDPLSGPAPVGAPFTTRMLASATAGPAINSVFVNGWPSGYQANAGQFVDMLDQDSQLAWRYGWVGGMGIGPTSARAAWLAGPAGLGGRSAGQLGSVLYFTDTTLNKVVVFDGTSSTWRDPGSGASV